MQKPPTLQTIADRAGVSRMTVSLALRNHPKLLPETRQRIQALARELGYRPNPLVAAHMTHLRTRGPVKGVTTVAFITGFSTRDGWRNDSQLFRDYFDGASERANQLGYRLEEVWAKEPGMSGRRLTEILLARGIRGLLIGPVPTARGHLSLDWSKFAVAALGFSVWKPEIARACVNQYQCVTLALRQLKRLGYRRIGLVVHARVDERVNHHCSAALWVYHHQIPRSDRVEPLLAKTLDERSFVAWLEKNRPDAILSNQEPILGWLANRGLRVPRDIGLVHIQLEEATRECAGIRQNGNRVGAAVVDLVVGQMQRNETGIPESPQLVLLSGDWKDGPTVRSPARGGVA